VRRVVYCSSVATMGFEISNGRPVTEVDPVSLAEMIGITNVRSSWPSRSRSKQEARANVVIVNPTTPVGEQDIKPTPTGRIILDFLKGNFPPTWTPA